MTSTSLFTAEFTLREIDSGEVEVPPGVLIRALRAAPVGPCFINYLQ